MLDNAGAGVLAQLVTYPIDTVRRRLEVRGSHGYELKTRRSRQVSVAVDAILRREGFRGFYRGLLVNCIKTVPSTALQVRKLHGCLPLERACDVMLAC